LIFSFFIADIMLDSDRFSLYTALFIKFSNFLLLMFNTHISTMNCIIGTIFELSMNFINDFLFIA